MKRNSFYMYHHEFGRDGVKYYTDEGHTPESLTKQGWVDDPTKFGHWSLAGGNEVNEKIKYRESEFAAGKLPSLDEVGGSVSMADFEIENIRLQAENRRLTESLAAREAALRQKESRPATQRQHIEKVESERDAGEKAAQKGKTGLHAVGDVEVGDEQPPAEQVADEAPDFQKF